MQEVSYLLTHGVRLDEALHMSNVRRKAFCICIGELNGGVFNHRRGAWEAPKS